MKWLLIERSKKHKNLSKLSKRAMIDTGRSRSEENIITNEVEIKKAITHLYNTKGITDICMQWYTNKFDNLEEIDESLDDAFTKTQKLRNRKPKYTNSS